jgi:hypothetical protein
MEDKQKISLMELVLGLREPETGMEKHFLKVIKGQSIACSPEEKEWFEWWKKTHNKTKETVASKEVVTKVAKPTVNKHKVAKPKIAKTRLRPPPPLARKHIRSIQSRLTPRYARSTSEFKTFNPNLERIQKEKEAEIKRLAEQGPKPEPKKTSASELAKLKTKGTTSYVVDDGIAGSREDNKKMRANQGRDIYRRMKGGD